MTKRGFWWDLNPNILTYKAIKYKPLHTQETEAMI